MQKNSEAQLPLEQLRQIRIDKLEKLRKLGIDPYPSKSYKNINNSEIKNDYPKYEGKEVIVAGRVVSKRTHGLIAFFDIKDSSSIVQLYLKSDNLKTADYVQSQIKYQDLDLIDEGDFVEAKGKVVKTKSGEVSVEANSIRILVKTLRPMPKSLKDREIRYRRRYVDTNINEDVYQRFIRRAKFWEAHREFFNSRGFFEINTPVLEHISGGGDAVPFVTHMDSIDEDFYLRISHELPLKRLVGGGYDKVYDIGSRFRNEGLSDEHLPEHVAMEFYWAYANWQDGMELVKELYNFVIKKVYGDKKVFKIRGFDVDFSKNWEVIDFAKALQIKFGFSDLFSLKLKDIIKILKENGVTDKVVNIPRGVDHLWKLARKDIAGSAFVVNHPKYLSPLQKPSSDDPNIVERFQPIIAGSELGNGWSEVNDPIDQFERFNEQQKMRDAGDTEAQWLDIDYVEMLEYGMPPTFGYGHSERLFWFLEDVPARDGVPFPQLKFELEDSTKKIYGIKEKPKRDKEHGIKSGGSFSVDPQLKKDFPGIFYAYTVINGVNIKKSNNDLNKLKDQVTRNFKGYKLEDIDQIKPIIEYRALFKATGTDLHSKRPSPDALLRRVVQGKGLYNVNTAVDAYNVAVLETHVGLGGFNYDKVEEPVTLRYSKKGEKMKLLGDDEATILREKQIVYSDSKKPITLDLNYRDIDETKITIDTKNIILFADGTPGLAQDTVVEALKKGVEYIRQFCGGNIGEIVIVK